MIQRKAQHYLSSWFSKKHRKPLVIRGARQVGKTSLVREFARRNGYPLVEINLEKHTGMEEVFQTLRIQDILREISLATGTSLKQVENTILFLDEIQATPSAIPALRYLYEEKPDLHVIAAGSLLEFTLRDHSFTMPVGRIEFLYLGPLTFREYVVARGSQLVLDFVQEHSLSNKFSPEVHRQMLALLREYLVIGGMPEPVDAFIDSSEINQAFQIHHSIIDTYRSDFSKYATGSALQRLQRVFDYVPSATGQKFKYRNVHPDWQSRDIRHAVDLLDQAGVICRVHATSGAGIPLEAQADNTIFKPFFLDVGLMNSLLGVHSLSQQELLSTRFINEGTMAEQFIAQHLRFSDEPYRKPVLHYWLRERKAANAEVDFLIQAGATPVPVEVKAGKSGSMKSLHLFCNTFSIPTAVRFDVNTPSAQQTTHNIALGSTVKTATYTLISLPLYMVEEVRRIIGNVRGRESSRVEVEDL